MSFTRHEPPPGEYLSLAANERARRPRPNEAGYPKVQGKCPACGSTTLFLGSDGFVTCGLIGGRTSRGCPNPAAASEALGAL